MSASHGKAAPGYRIMNHGRALAHPLESSYGLARRLMVANPNISLKALSELLDTAKHSERVDSVEYCGGLSNRRQCAFCASQLFHPTVYDLPSLLLCPIHHSPLIMNCPDCKQPWERPFTRRNPVCETCGLPPWESLGRIRLKQASYRDTRWLTDWLTQSLVTRRSHKYLPLYNIDEQLRPALDIQSPPFQRLTVQHRLYCAFESQKQGGILNQRLKRLHVLTVDQPLRTRTTQLKRWRPPPPLPKLEGGREDTIKFSNAISESTLLTYLALAIRRILRWQRKVVGAKHDLTWFDIRNIRPEQVREGAPPCILCMAFSFWCRAISLQFINANFGGVPGEHELCRFTGYERYPNIPGGVYVVGKKGKFYRPSPSFERWLFLRSSDFAFMEFVQLASWIYKQVADESVAYQQTAYSAKHKFYLQSCLSSILEVKNKQVERKLEAVFWKKSPLEEASLSGIELKKVQRCHAFLRCDCHRIWTVDSNPARLQRSTILALLDDILPSSTMNPYLYRWMDSNFDYKRLPYMKPLHDMRIVK